MKTNFEAVLENEDEYMAMCCIGYIAKEWESGAGCRLSIGLVLHVLRKFGYINCDTEDEETPDDKIGGIKRRIDHETTSENIRA